MKFKSKLLFISPSFYPATYYGGPIISTYKLVKQLSLRGIDINVVSTNCNGKEKLRIRPNRKIINHEGISIKYYGLASRNGFSLPMFCCLWIDILMVDVVYIVSIFSPSTPLALLFSIFFRKKVIISPRGQLGNWCLAKGSTIKKIWLNIFISPFINKINWHLTSNMEKDHLIKVYSNARLFVVPNGVEIDSNIYLNRIGNKVFKKYFGTIDENCKKIISLGRYHKIKGFDILINAMEILLNECNDYYLIIAGEDFGEKENIQKLINMKGMGSKVALLDYIKGIEKENLLVNSDLFALASHHENFGLVYAEALVAGIPIVASNNTPWQIANKYKFGKCVNNNAEEFAKAIKDILNCDHKKMGENGRKYIIDNFSWKKLTNDFICALHKVENETPS